MNTTDSQKCKPLEEIDYYLKNTFVTFGIEDIELTPKNYKNLLDQEIKMYIQQ